MNLAEQLDNTLRNLAGYTCAREIPGCIWLAGEPDVPRRGLDAVARSVRTSLQEMGFVVGPVANEPTALGHSPCVHVCGIAGENHPGENERLVIVSQTMLERLRGVQLQLRALNVRDPSYDNVKEIGRAHV
jgi:hypothetical protein